MTFAKINMPGKEAREYLKNATESMKGASSSSKLKNALVMAIQEDDEDIKLIKLKNGTIVLKGKYSVIKLSKSDITKIKKLI
ncbi:hypothetical protein KY334_07700 [Candidatus Woesearchaeota archaeon]|nr:hypothetical protein [Candidatus Woesearchaeota archaeon]